MQWNKFVCTGVVSLAMCTAGAFAQSKPANYSDANGAKVTKADQTFLMEAAQGGIAEVELGKLAAQKTNDPQVKDFANKMVQDHEKANDQLKQVAQQDSVPVPTEPTAREKAEKNRLAKLSGSIFDKAYMKHMVTDHTKDVADFKKESKEAQDPNVKQFASQTLPTLEQHLQLARQVDQKITGGKTATGPKNTSSFK